MDMGKGKGKGKMIAIGVSVIFVLAVAFSSCGKNKMLDAPKDPKTAQQVSQEDADTQLQKILVNRYGKAPEGFKWKDDGSLIALGDANLTSEEVAYNYLKSASMLEFEMLGKSSQKSQVVKTYQRLYADDTQVKIFKRKMYKESLKTIKINKLNDSVLFANNSQTFTFSINILDLSDKDFWKNDSEKIFQNLYTYYRDEKDSTKAKQYIYDYILSWYSDQSSPKHDVEVELIASKNNKTGAWLITDDSSLDKVCTYDNGELVSDYIYQCYQKWYEEKLKARK